MVHFVMISKHRMVRLTNEKDFHLHFMPWHIYPWVHFTLIMTIQQLDQQWIYFWQNKPLVFFYCIVWTNKISFCFKLNSARKSNRIIFFSNTPAICNENIVHIDSSNKKWGLNKDILFTILFWLSWWRLNEIISSF